MSTVHHTLASREASSVVLEFDPLGRCRLPLKHASALRDITPAIAEAERRRLLGAGHNCWYCSQPAPADSWLFSCRMRERPVGMLVCPTCLPRVRGWRPGIQIRLFPPQAVQP